jgi:hypothetical protein
MLPMDEPRQSEQRQVMAQTPESQNNVTTSTALLRYVAHLSTHPSDPSVSALFWHTQRTQGVLPATCLAAKRNSGHYTPPLNSPITTGLLARPSCLALPAAARSAAPIPRAAPICANAILPHCGCCLAQLCCCTDCHARSLGPCQPPCDSSCHTQRTPPSAHRHQKLVPGKHASPSTPSKGLRSFHHCCSHP